MKITSTFRSLLLLFCLLSLKTSGQYRVTFVVTSLPFYHNSKDTIFLAGNFNNWNPRDKNYALRLGDGMPGITIELGKGMYEYKLTAGGWDHVESGEGGVPTANRMLQVESDTTIEVQVQHWAHHFPQQEKKSTAGKNVCLFDSAFYIPQLNRYRRIWIYLPESYCDSKKQYPVLYMQDGQNVFDDATAGFGEWGVDEALDSLGSQADEIIVVAIDNGGEKRMNEYSPFDMEKFGKGEGDLYVDFLVQTLKPYIDKNFRTKKGRNDTWIAGSSMGGLISFYAMMKYPQTFGGAGVFSPSFWIAPQMKQLDPEHVRRLKGKIYFFAGQKESEEMVPDMMNVFEQLRSHSKVKLKTVIRAEGQHNEATWRAEFPEFFRWMVQKK